MKKKRNELTWNDKLENLEAFLDGSEEDEVPSMAARREQLESRGIDVQRTIDLVRDRVAALRAKERLEEARLQRSALIEKMKAHAPTSEPSVFEQISQRLLSLVGTQPQLAGVYFRRFEKCGDEDMQSLLADLKMLEALDGEID